jgi:hypothetical protein
LTALPVFVALLRKEASSLADGSDVLAAFDRVVGDPPHEDVFVQDWTWLDLAAHMSWALTDPSAFNAFAAELRRRAEHLDPVLLYLSVDTDRGVRRAADERGQRWLTRHADTFASIREPGVTVESVATFYREHEHKRIERLTTGGWNPS